MSPTRPSIAEPPGPHEASSPAPPSEVAAVPRPSPPSGGTAPRRGSRRALWVGGVVLLFHAVVAAWALWPSRAPAERLAAAARERDRSARENRLQGLGRSQHVDAAQLVRAAELLLEVDGFTTLREVARDLQRVAPGDLRGPLWEARAELELHMIDAARDAIARAEALAPNDVRPLLLLAELGERSGEVDTTLLALARASVLEGAPPELGLRYGVLLSRAGHLEEATKVLSRRATPQTLATARAELAFVLHRQGQDAQARALLAHAITQDPDAPLAHHYLGIVLHALGEVQAAEDAWRRADALEPTEPRHLAALCELLGRDPARARDATTLANLFRRRFPLDASHIGGACFAPHRGR